MEGVHEAHAVGIVDLQQVLQLERVYAHQFLQPSTSVRTGEPGLRTLGIPCGRLWFFRASLAPSMLAVRFADSFGVVSLVDCSEMQYLLGMFWGPRIPAAQRSYWQGPPQLFGMEE